MHHYTPKGVRLCNGQFVLHHAKKKFAHATQAEAREAFVKRKERYIGILSGHIADAERGIEMIKGMQDEPDPTNKSFWS